jgi:hypothetical protein
MKTIQLFTATLVFFAITSCSTIRVNSDFDRQVNFEKYKTYAFHKSGIDKVEISDLDKKRILRAIDMELEKKGMTKSETPNLLISFSTKERERIDINQYSMGWGYCWNPFFWGGQSTISTVHEGTLSIDLIDAEKMELVWQGKGTGYLTQDSDEKDKRVCEFVCQILGQFPPVKK